MSNGMTRRELEITDEREILDILNRSMIVQPFEGDVACRYGTSYKSLMGHGTAIILNDPDEKMNALSIFMKTQTGKDFEFNEKLVKVVSVIKITVSSYTAKYRRMPKPRG